MNVPILFCIEYKEKQSELNDLVCIQHLATNMCKYCIIINVRFNTAYNCSFPSERRPNCIDACNTLYYTRRRIERRKKSFPIELWKFIGIKHLWMSDVWKFLHTVSVSHENRTSLVCFRSFIFSTNRWLFKHNFFVSSPASY